MDKKLFYTQADYGQAFWDQDGEPITCFHESDADFRDEYMGKLLKHFGIEVKYSKDVPDAVREVFGDQIWEM